MPLINANINSSGLGSGSAGAQAGRTRVMAEQKKREGFLKSYQDQKSQIATTLSTIYKGIQDKHLVNKNKIKSFKFAEGEDRSTEMLNALEANRQKELAKFEDLKQSQIQSFSDSVHAPLMALGIIPNNQAGIDRQAFNQIGRGLDAEEQAYIDALPTGAKEASKAEAVSETQNWIGPNGERIAVAVTDTVGAEDLRRRGFQKQTPVSIGVQATTLEGAGLTTAQRGKEKQKALDAQEALLNMRDEVKHINTLLDEGGEGGFVADVYRSADALVSMATSMAEFAGIKIETTPQTSLIDMDVMLPKLKEKGVLSQKVKNGIMSLAYMVAASEDQTGRALSDEDLERVLRRIGDSSSIAQLRASMKEEIKRAERKYINKMKVRFDKNISFPKEKANPKEKAKENGTTNFNLMAKDKLLAVDPSNLKTMKELNAYEKALEALNGK